MNQLHKFYLRLKAIGIDITCIGNYPWIYLDTVNGNRVVEKYMANHGFTIAILTQTDNIEITDRKKIFEIIRKYR